MLKTPPRFVEFLIWQLKKNLYVNKSHELPLFYLLNELWFTLLGFIRFPPLYTSVTLLDGKGHWGQFAPLPSSLTKWTQLSKGFGQEADNPKRCMIERKTSKEVIHRWWEGGIGSVCRVCWTYSILEICHHHGILLGWSLRDCTRIWHSRVKENGCLLDVCTVVAFFQQKIGYFSHWKISCVDGDCGRD